MLGFKKLEEDDTHREGPSLASIQAMLGAHLREPPHPESIEKYAEFVPLNEEATRFLRELVCNKESVLSQHFMNIFRHYRHQSEFLSQLDAVLNNKMTSLTMLSLDDKSFALALLSSPIVFTSDVLPSYELQAIFEKYLNVDFINELCDKLGDQKAAMIDWLQKMLFQNYTLKWHPLPEGLEAFRLDENTQDKLVRDWIEASEVAFTHSHYRDYVATHGVNCQVGGNTYQLCDKKLPLGKNIAIFQGGEITLLEHEKSISLIQDAVRFVVKHRADDSIRATFVALAEYLKQKFKHTDVEGVRALATALKTKSNTAQIGDKKYHCYPLDDFVQHETGVCRHFAIFTTLIIQQLIEQKVLPKGRSWHHRQYLDPDKGRPHAWAIYEDAQSNTLWSVDTFWHSSTQNAIFDLSMAEQRRACDTFYQAGEITPLPVSWYILASFTSSTPDMAPTIPKASSSNAHTTLTKQDVPEASAPHVPQYKRHLGGASAVNAQRGSFKRKQAMVETVLKQKPNHRI